MRKFLTFALFLSLCIQSSLTTAAVLSQCQKLFVDFELQESISSLARLRIELDIAKALNNNTLSMLLLQRDFDRKESDLKNFVEGQKLLSKDEFDENLRNEISRQQKDKVENKILLPTPKKLEAVDGRISVFNPVAPGSFKRINSKGDESVVTIDASFELMATEVTQIIWKKIAAIVKSYKIKVDGKIPYNPSDSKSDLKPVESLSALEIELWIKALNTLSGLGVKPLEKIIVGHKDGDTYRLPSFDEWEFVLRGRGRYTEKHFFDESEMNEFVWNYTNSGTSGKQVNNGRTSQEVAKLKPLVVDGWEFYDMLGNVRELLQVEPGRSLIHDRRAAGGDFYDWPQDIHGNLSFFVQKQQSSGFRLLREMRKP